jgi:hypothetical protein
MLHPTWLAITLADWAPVTGPPAVAGVGGGASTERIPRDKPPNLARRGEISTKSHKLRPALSCEPLPNHVPCAPAGPLRGYLRATCVTAAWCGPITIMLARGVGAPNNTTWRFTMHLLVAGKAHHRPGTFHSRHIGVSKGKLHI